MTGYNIFKYRLLCLFIMMSILPFSFAKSITVDRELKKVPLGLNIDYLEDKDGTHTIEDVAAAESQSQWHQSNKRYPGFGFTTSVYWVRFTLHNSDSLPVSFLLVHALPLIDALTLYIPENDGYTALSTGLHVSVTERPYDHRNLVFPLELSPGLSKTYYIRQKASLPMRLFFFIQSEKAFIKESTSLLNLYMFFYGILLTLALYNFVIFFFIRLIEYLYFVLVVISIFFLHAIDCGIVPQLLWPERLFLSPSIFAFCLLAGILSMLLFMLEKIPIKKNYPRLYIMAKILIIINCLVLIICCFVPFTMTIVIIIVNGILTVVYMFACSFLMMIKRCRAALFFFIANVTLQIGIIISLLMTLNSIQFNLTVSIINHIAAVILFIMYALSLGDKVYTMNKDLKVLNTDLEKKVKDRTAALHDSHEKLRELDRLKSNFFANISHEIRTPLTLILSPVDAVLRGEYKDTVDKPFLKTIQRNGRRLLRLINNILDIAKLEAQKVSLEIHAVTITALLDRYLTAVKPALESKGIILNVKQPDDPPLLYIDYEKIGTVFMNVFSNAFKYTQPGGKIGVTITGDNAYCRIDIADTGPGIPADALGRVFDRFSRVDASSVGTHEGTGIGLSLAKELVELHAGFITVSSRYYEDFPDNHGTVFSISLQLGTDHFAGRDDVVFLSDTSVNDRLDNDEYWKMAGFNEIYDVADIKSPQTEPPASISPEIIRGRGNIMIVEDNHELRQYLTEALGKTYNVFTADNGEMALKVLTKIPKPDVILSDIMMPLMDGYELYRCLSRDKRFNDIPVIFLTARTGIDEKIRGLSEGAVDYIYKPFSLSEVQAKIAAIIKNEELKQLLYEKDKLRTLGMLTGGLCHEILNPLQMIYGPVDLLEMEFEKRYGESEPVKKYFNNIIGNVERIKTIVKTMKVFSENDTIIKEEIFPAAVIQSVLDIFENRLDGSITCSNAVDRDVTVIGNENILHRILENLIGNALDAIDGIDAIEVAGMIEVRYEEVKNQALIVVKDNGRGIDREHIPRIFDAFYSGKEPGQGIGLGLYIVKELTYKMGWMIDVYSTPGEGAEFVLTIPMTGGIHE